ncbi:MAG TPA: aldo/keto reductase [Actinomycetes bacterium]|nr:aldo/keto reductase [Actinomycetes bacterium]
MTHSVPGGTRTLADDLTISRMGYGAMQLAGLNVFGPPKDHDQALAVLRHAVELGITHIDTADYYGLAVVNQLIKQALHPYPDDLHIVTKVGARRGEDGSWKVARDPDDLKAQVHENLQHLGLDVLDVANLRMGSAEGTSEESIAEPFGALAELRQQGLVHQLGLSGISPAQLTEAQTIAPVVTVQNLYNLSNRCYRHLYLAIEVPVTRGRPGAWRRDTHRSRNKLVRTLVEEVDGHVGAASGPDHLPSPRSKSQQVLRNPGPKQSCRLLFPVTPQPATPEEEESCPTTTARRLRR